MEVGEAPRNLRLVSGPVAEVEAWVNAHWDTYVITAWAWSVIENRQHVTVTAILRSEVEKMQRMMQFAMNAQQGPMRRT